MLETVESKPQGWRAMAAFDDDRHHALLYLGRSSTQVRAGYVEAFLEILEEEEREHVSAVELQHWQGAPDDGRWILHTTLKVPQSKLVKVAA